MSLVRPIVLAYLSFRLMLQSEARKDRDFFPEFILLFPSP